MTTTMMLAHLFRSVPCCLLLLVLAPVISDDRFQLVKERAFSAYRDNCRAAWRQCSAHPQFPQHVVDFDHSLRRPSAGAERGRRAIDLLSRDVVRATKGKAVYLSAHSGTLLRDFGEHTQWSAFTLDLWLMPEGGQENPAVILAAEDLCSPFEEKGWTLGIRATENGGETNGHVFFSLQTHQSKKTTTLASPLRYEPGSWTYVLITYDGQQTRLFINSAQVAVSYEQKGDLFRGLNPDSCIALQLGGYDGHFFRGAISNLRLRDSAIEQSDVQDSMFERQEHEEEAKDLFFESFESLDGWEWIGNAPYSGQTPQIIAADLPTRRYNMRLKPPQCGYTICDVPEIVKSYETNSEMRQKKTVRYRVIDVRDSDGLKPTVNNKQVKRQDEALRQAFTPYNISWELHLHRVTNSSLRRRTVTFGCMPTAVGNGECNPECQFAITQNDGGDCDVEQTKCDPSLRNNGHCDDDCNRAYHDWDGGDCCNPLFTNASTTCADPESKERAYIDLQEYKEILQLKSDEYLNIFFALWNNKEIVGVATFPWEKIVFDVQGGVVVNPDDFGVDGRLDTLVHEMGHALGLWHVHRGVSEADCNDLCFESHPSMELGDMCEDTPPTPQNAACRDPEPETTRCGLHSFTDTPFNNYMSYADDACVDSFSNQQVARMHCYIDLQYSRWLAKKTTPPGPPLPPVVVGNSPTSVTFSWRPPLNDALFYAPSDCSMCNQERALLQYASSATSPSGVGHFSSIWHPHQATGPPDAEFCSPSYKSWMPDTKLCTGEECFLTVTFPVAVIPSALSVWIPWNARIGLSEITLLYTDGTSESLGSYRANCDIPLTLPMATEKALKQIRLVPRGPFVSIDAVQLTSSPSHQLCAPCKPLRYKVTRDPPLSKTLIADDFEFTDREVKSEETYIYRVQSFLGPTSSLMSPPLRYRHRTHFCGDSWIKENEQCDDGNIIDGDGCSASCLIEKNFRCTGEPSLCYWHTGDGVCETFEKESVIEDCGFVTPPGRKDQWAISVKTNQTFYSKSCSPDVILGPPSNPKICGPDLNASLGWYPCEHFASANFWLNAYFHDPVVAISVAIYLSSDGLSSLSHENLAHLHLIDTKGGLHQVTHLYLSCHRYPLEVGITHDLSKPFFLTQGVRLSFTSPEVAVAAVQLRSSPHLNPVALSSCNDLYSPSLERCVRYECRRPTCGRPLVKNAQVKCSGEADGDVCHLVCDDGYLPSSDATSMICVDSSWIGGDPYCKPIDCGLPLIPHADAMCPDGTTLGRSCHFKCRPPARLKGSSTSITCLKSGHWSQAESRCQLTCTKPAGPDHALLVSQYCRSQDSFVFGQRCRFRCKLGFHVAGYSKRRRTLQWMCDSTGSWSGEECFPVTCPEPQIGKGRYNCTVGFAAGSTCNVFCPENKEALKSIRCEADGMWSYPFPSCTSGTVTCPQPQSEDPELKISCPSRAPGGTCTISCTPPDKEPVKIAANGSELFNHDKLRLVCSGEGKWIPEPQSLVCRERCNMEYAGDGYCDAANNRDRCQWDGGDCCSSTVTGHVVKPFPPNCKEECTCKDPSSVGRHQ